MASVITATTTSGLTQSADNSGVLQLASGVGNLVTVPAVTGTAMVSGNMPAFSAGQTTLQSVANNTFTKIQLQTEEFDTASCFNNTASTVSGIPAYAFLPNVAGYYQVNGTASFSGSGAVIIASIYKNGTEFKRGVQSGSGANSGTACIASALIYFNGSTDYVELYGYQASGSALNTAAASNTTYFQAILVRGA
jgi:hypothetical protein